VQRDKQNLPSRVQVEEGPQQNQERQDERPAPSIKMMIESASAIECNKVGELIKNFMSLYNSKTYGSLDIQLHQLFEDAGIGDVVLLKEC
jgi:hypothetical protein